MTRLPSLVAAVLVTAAAAAPAGAAAALAPARASAKRIVVHGHRIGFDLERKAITYSSSRGRYTATWIGVRHYRLRGTIDGRRLTGKIRTRQTRDGNHYRARGSGKLGGRAVHIGGGGPNDLSKATLILR
jgi:hypothetical protein